MYSQNNEEAIITSYFEGRKGKFIDIGAFDGITFSNVRKLAELGWVGTLFEPDKELHKRVLSNYEDYSIVAVNAAVGTHNGYITFFGSNGDAVGTTSEKHKEKWHIVNFADGVTVQCYDINEVIHRPVEFVNIDVEGTNIELFRHMTDETIKYIEMLCIEHDGHYEEIRGRMKGLGYTELLYNGENIIFAKI